MQKPCVQINFNFIAEQLQQGFGSVEKYSQRKLHRIDKAFLVVGDLCYFADHELVVLHHAFKRLKCAMCIAGGPDIEGTITPHIDKGLYVPQGYAFGMPYIGIGPTILS
jgi:hypothetical protein